MSIARVVTFDGVNSERMAEMQKEMEDNSERPENVPAKGGSSSFTIPRLTGRS